MNASLFLRGVFVLAVAAAAGGAVPGAGGSTPGVVGRIFFSSNRAPDLNPQLIAVDSDGGGRKQITSPLGAFDQPDWSPDGSRIAYRVVHDGRYDIAVANADGSGEALLTNDNDYDASPVWSPDGTTVAFLSTREGFGIDTIPAAGGTPKKIADQVYGTPPVWSPDGTEIAHTGGSWEAPSVDVTRISDGSTREVAGTPWFPSALDWSPDGNRIAYSVGSLYVAAADGSGTVQLTTTYDDDPAFSPDGKSIAFDSWTEGGTDICAIGVDGTGFKRLTDTDGASERLPAWSPDGNTVAAARTDGNGQDGRVVIVAADGSGDRAEVDNGEYATIDSGPRWTSDGTKLVYAEHLTWNDRELYSLEPDGSGLRQLTHDEVDESHAAVSPDGRWVAFDRGPAGRQELYVVRTDGTGLRRLTRNRFVADVEPEWSPDGTRIAFVSDRGGKAHVYVIDADGRHVRRLTSGRAPDSFPAWSPDGSWIAFTSQQPDNGLVRQIWAVRPDGKGLRRLDHQETAEAASWSPRGSRLAYVAAEPGTGGYDQRYAAFVMDADGRDDHLVGHGAAEQRPAWSGDGSMVAFSDGQLRIVDATGASGFYLTNAPGVSDGPAWQSRCTITGTAKNDRLVGGPGDDVICGLGGSDTLVGGGGSDVLIGGDGNDTLTGGAGRDLLFGAGGSDRLLGRDGSRDVVDGGPGRDAAQADRRDLVRSIER